MKKILLTGDRPTGKLHLGHYAGSLENRVNMQKEYKSFIMVADVQALTDNFNDPEKVRENVFEVVVDNLSVGVDPNLTSIFIQSQIPQIAELTVFYSNLVTISELERNPTVKNEIQNKSHIFKDNNVTFGFLGYPVSQAADITFLRANVVPVGEDQKPMIEQTHRIIRKFNKYYGEVFPYPKGIYSNITRLAGLDGRKMSKSLDNAIYISDSSEEIEKKIKKSKTDSDTENLIRFDLEKKPDVSNLILYYQLATKKSIKDIEQEFQDLSSYKLFKDDLIKKLNIFLEPFRKKRSYYEKNSDLVWDILKHGYKQATLEAEKTMELVRKKMKINY